MSDVEKMAAGLSEAVKRDLTDNWDHFCEADRGLIVSDDPNYPDQLEAAGYVEFDAVDDDDLEEPFAWERGIVPGGSVLRLTPLGLALRDHLRAQEGVHGR